MTASSVGDRCSIIVIIFTLLKYADEHSANFLPAVDRRAFHTPQIGWIYYLVERNSSLLSQTLPALVDGLSTLIYTCKRQYGRVVVPVYD